MFQSYKFIKSLEYKNGKSSWEYELTDSDFGTISGVGVEVMVAVGVGVEVEVGGNGWVEIDVAIAVIQEYSKRKLNVGKNLMLAFVWYNKLNPWYSIQQMIDFNKKYNPLFSQYEEDLQKYLPMQKYLPIL